MLKCTAGQSAGFIALLAAAGSIAAFETETHGLITYNAYKRSVLADSSSASIRRSLGLDRLPSGSPFATQWLATIEVGYFDNIPALYPYAYPPFFPSVTQYVRLPHQYENCQMRTLQSADWFGQLSSLDDVSGSLSSRTGLSAERFGKTTYGFHPTKQGVNVTSSAPTAIRGEISCGYSTISTIPSMTPRWRVAICRNRNRLTGRWACRTASPPRRFTIRRGATISATPMHVTRCGWP